MVSSVSRSCPMPRKSAGAAAAALVAVGLCLATIGCRKATPPAQENPPPPAAVKAPPQADRLTYTATAYSWKTGAPAVKLLGTQNGFCFLAGVSGNFQGYGEQADVHPGKDGSWYLEGRSQQAELSAAAVGIAGLTSALVRPDVKEYSWGKGKPPVKMLHKDQGFCYLSSVAGNFAGYGEDVGVRLADDGYWYLDGKSGQDQLGAKAVGVEWTTPGASAAEFKQHEWSAGKPPVQLVKKDEGFAVLMSVSGSLGSYGDEVQLYLANDGYWYLSGKAAGEALRARALAVRPRSGSGPRKP